MDVLEKVNLEVKYAEDQYFFVVDDIAPAVEGHKLLFPKKQVKSLADTSLTHLAEFIENIQPILGEEYIIIEKGRSSFCSTLSCVVAHAHLVPVNHLPLIQKRLEKYDFDEHREIASALDSVPDNHPYLVWGRLGGRAFINHTIPSFPKQLLRELLR